MDVTYPVASDMPDLDTEMDQKVDLVVKSFDRSRHNRNQTAQVLVRFLPSTNPKQRKKTGWFGHSREEEGEKVPWESWRINVRCFEISSEEHIAGVNQDVVNSAERLLHLSVLSFEDVLREIYSIVDKHQDHIPPIMTLDVAPFPHDISVNADREAPAPSDESWGQYIKKIME